MAHAVETIIEKFPKEIRHVIKKFSLNEIESSFGFLLNDNQMNILNHLSKI